MAFPAGLPDVNPVGHPDKDEDVNGHHGLETAEGQRKLKPKPKNGDSVEEAAGQHGVPGQLDKVKDMGKAPHGVIQTADQHGGQKEDHEQAGTPERFGFGIMKQEYRKQIARRHQQHIHAGQQPAAFIDLPQRKTPLYGTARRPLLSAGAGGRRLGTILHNNAILIVYPMGCRFVQF